ncbi:uncharacterized protein LOC143215004 [Lasioglossum baleicum]|uniref:uncharacterized protein LOC143215004 n=1 Tax=Lasioglossum baleicum TaxID=434251 RepID=UPI003FCD8B4F
MTYEKRNASRRNSKTKVVNGWFVERSNSVSNAGREESKSRPNGETGRKVKPGNGWETTAYLLSRNYSLASILRLVSTARTCLNEYEDSDFLQRRTLMFCQAISRDIKRKRRDRRVLFHR